MLGWLTVRNRAGEEERARCRLGRGMPRLRREAPARKLLCSSYSVTPFKVDLLSRSIRTTGKRTGRTWAEQWVEQRAEQRTEREAEQRAERHVAFVWGRGHSYAGYVKLGEQSHQWGCAFPHSSVSASLPCEKGLIMPLVVNGRQ